ncbi:MAG: hypothetical protein NT098_04970 [Candidatus Parcubacteria bacterium]|nr:hypothetical protein [Candidatus Parcubacteria bacterium]
MKKNSIGSMIFSFLFGAFVGAWLGYCFSFILATYSISPFGDYRINILVASLIMGAFFTWIAKG